MKDWLLNLTALELGAWLLGIFLFLSAVASAVRHAKKIASEYALYNGRVYRDYDDWRSE